MEATFALHPLIRLDWRGGRGGCWGLRTPAGGGSHPFLARAPTVGTPRIVARVPQRAQPNGSFALRAADVGKKGPGKLGSQPGTFSPGAGANDGGAEREREGGGTAVITKVKPKAKPKEKVEYEPMWRVLLHNDDVHTFMYVTYALVKVVKTLTRFKAHRITVQAHKAGVATVTTTWKQLAEEYCQGLQREGLTSSIMPERSSAA
ncbi:hypothetical protein CDCA_CDCA08G2428 [Cyanidium caldarium]|uniref:Adaptor protein ClpS core domain-containing protein n=1 Tax=Cyanidium caldarium TaxID=2771 RepID=A0AAV9IX75_CYACA|nr:hypothetical protein CDCA_CDCA08G2428 [Cyanidium caldarium]